MSWFGEAKALLELRKTRLAMERIATTLEALLMKQQGAGFFSLRAEDDEGVEGEIINMGDAEFAEMEMMEREREQVGGVGMDEPLTIRGKGRWER